MNIIKRLRVRYILHYHPIPQDLWRKVTAQLPVLKGMTAVEKAHLRELTTLFLQEKNFIGVQELLLSDAMCLVIAVQACLPVLGIGLGSLKGWQDIIVYPGPFKVDREEKDAAGVVHRIGRALIGESWSRGPLILSWADVERDLQEIRSGRNVIIHEIAHKLDMLNGPADGYPPLHFFMDLKQWTASLSSAYRTLVRRVEHRHRTCINPYAATSPAEFFAVVSEYFFCAPETLHTHLADVYRQLQFYYRQNPLIRRLSATS
ncbi:MAG: M90 family metallopeptidase [Gammaproteobacteria bacterium]